MFRTTIYDDSHLRSLLSKAQNKKVYRELANEALQEIKENVEQATHVDTGLMKASWDILPLKMRDGGYAVMGELTNSAQNKSEQFYAEYELARGGDHDAVALGVGQYELKNGDILHNLLEGLLK